MAVDEIVEDPVFDQAALRRALKRSASAHRSGAASASSAALAVRLFADSRPPQSSRKDPPSAVIRSAQGCDAACFHNFT